MEELRFEPSLSNLQEYLPVSRAVKCLTVSLMQGVRCLDSQRSTFTPADGIDRWVFPRVQDKLLWPLKDGEPGTALEMVIFTQWLHSMSLFLVKVSQLAAGPAFSSAQDDSGCFHPWEFLAWCSFRVYLELISSHPIPWTFTWEHVSLERCARLTHSFPAELILKLSH